MPADHYLARLQEDITQRQLDLPVRAQDLRAILRKILVDARGEGKLKTSQDQILSRVVLLDETKLHRDHDKLWKDLKDRALDRRAFCIFGGVKNQGRDPSLSHFERDDGAWFDFSITVRETDGVLELLAYDFEIRFASGMGAPFLRFDLNLPDHSNQTARELRSHFHAGSDDLLLPAPMMSPSELCALFTNGARLPAVRKPRSPTDFEVRWLAQTLNRFSSPSAQQ